MTTLARAIDNFYERHPVAAMGAMILIAFVCMVAIAALNQDGAAPAIVYAKTV